MLFGAISLPTFAGCPRPALFLDRGPAAAYPGPAGQIAVLGSHDVRQGARPFFELLFTEGALPFCGTRSRPCPGNRGVRPCPLFRRWGHAAAAGRVLARDPVPHAGQVPLPALKGRRPGSGGPQPRQAGAPAGDHPHDPAAGRQALPYGLYRPQGRSAGQLFVSQGIGMSRVPFRFLAPPELVVLE